ncbi:hypothetical protein EYZ11_001430 [Aspergillus tanneri]|uniref:N-acetyltransferase domain-containing protein n=1 Tax=Aspergillus tanneri TaxID=1220188 RepID=A0A4S3JUM4_9EURO|nr:uncharacterized protein ATNIH1004_010228 [Aspergillus tanneri]KAA8643459.1 hypothetical protein ATNIH1004_010228 [Aspergillus tanneri]THC99109.1 hypothetical protein EYZ11_001430 [Aspergillus tanneri]
MAYQFFAKAHQSNKASTSPPRPSPLPSSSSSAQNNQHTTSPIQPPSLVALQNSSSSHTNIAAKLKPPVGGDPIFQTVAYPHPIESGYSTPHPHVTIEPVSTAHIPSLTRITGLLLPIRYPNSFYTATITDPVIASLSRVSIYHDHPVAAAAASPSTPAVNLGTSTGTDKVIGGIRCRLEHVPPMMVQQLPAQCLSHPRDPTNLYIQTLHLLSPYRGCGIAASLLNSLLFSTPPSSFSSSSGPRLTYRVSPLVKHYNIRTITAHVHEANDEGLKWYIARGFKVEDGVVENYYRRLKPSGARIVKLTLQWDNDDPDVCTSPESRVPNQLEQPVDDGNLASREEEDDDDDDDWEKVEADDDDDLGVRPFSGSKLLDADDSMRRKRKANDEPQR